MPKTEDSSLTVGERKQLSGLEGDIERGIGSFMDVGNALMQIRDLRLYTDVADTFEKYCTKRWGFSSSRARQFIGATKAAKVAESCLNNGVTMVTPVNERQARVLAALPDEQTQATVWAKAVKAAPKGTDGAPRVTAAQLTKVAKEVTGKPAKEKPADADKPKAADKPIVDKDGKAVPESLQGFFKRAGEFEALCKLLDEVAKTVEALASEPIGVHLHAQSIVADLTSTKSAIRFAKPYAVCPYCKGKGEIRGENCGACRKSGFVGRDKLKSAPAEMRA